MSKVTEKNTKKEIMEYVKELEAKISEKQESRKTTADIQAENKVKEVKKSAQELVDTGIVNEATVEKYNNLIETIKMLEEELEELYGIKKSAHTLEALIVAHEDKKEALEAEYAERKETLETNYKNRKAECEADIIETKESHNRLVKDLKESFKEEKANLEKERSREREEYNYKLLRERDIENDEWADEKAEREKELKEKEIAVIAREKVAEEAIGEIEELKASFEKLQKESAEAISAAFEDGKAKAAKEHAIAKSYIEKDCQAKLDRLQDKVNSLEESLSTERQAHLETKAKLDNAYKQVTDTAMAVAKAGVKVSMDTNK